MNSNPNSKRFNKNYYDRYQAGESIWSIVESENSTYKNVFEGIFGRRFESKLLLDEEKKFICESYSNGMSTVELGKYYGVGNKSIAYILEQNNIKRNQARFVRKYTLDEHYFDSIDTPNKAYILGLLYSDGNNCKEKGTIRIQLQEGDRDVLEKIRKELNYSRELRYVDCSKRIYGNGYVSKNMYTLDMFSSHMCNQLEQLGVVPNKSLILKFPDFLSEELIPHFLRGYMDGDGSIAKHSYGVNLTSTEDFCNSVYEIVKNTLDIAGKIVDASCHNGVTKVFKLGKYDDSKPFLDYIYHNADIYLDRKYNLYIEKFTKQNLTDNPLSA